MSYPIAYGGLQAGFQSENISEIINILAIASFTRDVFLVTARSYGSEKLYGNLLRQIPNKIKTITKVGIEFNPQNPFTPLSELEDQIRESSLLIPDLYCIGYHRIPPNATVREIRIYASILARLQKEGLFKKTIISEITANQLDEFHNSLMDNNSKLDFIEIAYSPFARRAEFNGVIDTSRKYNITILAYTSILRGLLTPKLLDFFSGDKLIPGYDNLPDKNLTQIVSDYLNVSEIDRTIGYMQPNVFRGNIICVAKFILLAQNLRISPSKLSLSYIYAKNIIPVPGSTNPSRVEENMQIVSLTDKIIGLIDVITANFIGSPNPSSLLYLDNPALDYH